MFADTEDQQLFDGGAFCDVPRGPGDAHGKGG
jgi:hypothetical protein